jgi:hypothetical protein
VACVQEIEAAVGQDDLPDVTVSPQRANTLTKLMT